MGSAPMPIARAVVGALAFVSCGAGPLVGCAAPNPLFEAHLDGGDGGGGGTGSGGSTAAGDEGAADGEPRADLGGMGGTGGGTGGGVGPDAVYVLSSVITNGSVEVGNEEGLDAAFDACVSRADAAQAIRCDVAVPFLFAQSVSTAEALDSLGLDPDRPVHSAAGVELAVSVAEFVQGDLSASLLVAGVVDDDVDVVWTGLGEVASENCQAWTSGKDRRTGRVGSTSARVDWVSAGARSCGIELTYLCLCG